MNGLQCTVHNHCLLGHVRVCRYSSASGGHLNELWVFSMDLMEWTQPDATGKAAVS